MKKKKKTNPGRRPRPLAPPLPFVFKDLLETSRTLVGGHLSERHLVVEQNSIFGVHNGTNNLRGNRFRWVQLQARLTTEDDIGPRAKIPFQGKVFQKNGT